MITRICIFCGSNRGNRTDYSNEAVKLVDTLKRFGLEIVFGGGGVGLMGVIADAAVRARVPITGVIPDSLVERELAHRGVNNLHVVKTMHERKALMSQLSDAFIALPGGVGTLEELFEVVSWMALGLHHKPIGLLNVAGYYDSLLKFLDHACTEGFVRPSHRDRIIVEGSSERLVRRILAMAQSEDSKET